MRNKRWIKAFALLFAVSLIAAACGDSDDGGGGDVAVDPPPPPTELPAEKRTRRFFGSVALDPDRTSRDAGRIAEEVLQHLTTLPGAKVEVTLEIHAELPDGVPDDVRRIVDENCRTLKFKDQDFEMS